MKGNEIILMKDQRALLIKADTDELRNRIAHAAPGTGYMNYQDRATFAVVPFNETTTLGLRNIGIEAPSPIMHLYDWPRMDKIKITPTPEQKLTSEFLTLYKRGVVLNGMGTGKTFASLWAADYMLRMGIETRPWLIMAPKSTLEVVWQKHLVQNFPYWKVKVLNGTNKRRLKRLGEDAMFYIINHDGFYTIAEELYDLFGGVIVDEADVLRNPDTKTLYQSFNTWRVAHPDIRVWPMTGTPMPRAPTDAWAIGRFIDNPYTPLSWYAFRERVMRQYGQYASDWEPRDDALEKVGQILQPSIRFTLEQSFSLPPTVVMTRHVEMSKPQKDNFKEMMKDLVTEIGGNEVTAFNEAAKRMKLMQICGGLVYHGEKIVCLDWKDVPRINVLRESIAGVDGKVIVFAPFRGILDMLKDEITDPSDKRNRSWTAEVINGSTSDKERARIFNAFQNDAHPEVLIAHPRTMSHGVNLARASGIVWYGPPPGNGIYLQANARIERPDKERTSVVVHLTSTKLEQQIYERLEGQQSLQNVLLDFIESQKGDIYD